MTDYSELVQQLPEYSAELLAANYPNRKDNILSGPYTPIYVARDALEAQAAEIKRLQGAWDRELEANNAIMQKYNEEYAENIRLRAALERLYDLVRKQGMDNELRAEIESLLAREALKGEK